MNISQACTGKLMHCLNCVGMCLSRYNHNSGAHQGIFFGERGMKMKIEARKKNLMQATFIYFCAFEIDSGMFYLYKQNIIYDCK